MSRESFNRSNYQQAMELLSDDKLVWSGDFDNIRTILRDVFSEQIIMNDYDCTNLNYLAEKLIEEENDLTI
jgi:hypothetical protein